MKRRKQLAALGLSLVTAASVLAGCGSSTPTETKAPSEGTAPGGRSAASIAKQASGDGEVYFLNFKPETATIWEEVMKTFTQETGIPATVMTAASGTYEQTLKSEVAKTKAPTLFQINGPVGYQSWKDYCLDLKDSTMYDLLSDKSLAITDGDGVYGIPYAIEGYGIIANKRIIADYCALDGAKVAAIDEINSFTRLKEVAEDMQARKDELGIEGAFASTSFAPGEDWRWQTHLANLPLYYEYKDKGISDAEEIDGTYLPNYKEVFDLYINNSCTKPSLLSSVSVEDSMAEFALEEAAFVQNGDWGWGQILDNNPDMSSDDVQFLPIYIGVAGEGNQGLCVGTENYWCINQQASEADQKATLQFVEWLLTSDTGKDYMVNKMALTAPFTSFGKGESPENPLAKSILDYAADGKTAVSWAFITMPNQVYKNNLGAALLEYAQGTGNWNGVTKAFVEGWKTEKANPTPE